MQLSEANPGTRTPVRPPKRNGTEIGDAAGGSSGHSDEVDCQPSTEITSCGSSENWMVLSIAGDKPIPRSNVCLFLQLLLLVSFKVLKKKDSIVVLHCELCMSSMQQQSLGIR